MCKQATPKYQNSPECGPLSKHPGIGISIDDETPESVFLYRHVLPCSFVQNEHRNINLVSKLRMNYGLNDHFIERAYLLKDHFQNSLFVKKLRRIFEKNLCLSV